MFIANATSSPKPLPPLGRPFPPGLAAEPADGLRWPLTLGRGSLSACLEPSEWLSKTLEQPRVGESALTRCRSLYGASETLSGCIATSGCDLSASNGLGVCQYRGEGDRPLDGHPGPPVAWIPVTASPRPGDPAHMTRESDPASLRAGDDRTAETIVQPPQGKVTLSSTLGTPRDSYLAELPTDVDTPNTKRLVHRASYLHMAHPTPTTGGPSIENPVTGIKTHP